MTDAHHAKGPKAFGADIRAKNAKEALEEALSASALAMGPPLWADAALSDPRLTRQARLSLRLLEGELEQRRQSLEDGGVTYFGDVELEVRPLAQISRMLVVRVLSEYLPRDLSRDLSTHVIGWLRAIPPKGLQIRFLRQGFAWHPRTDDAPMPTASARSGGWGAFDPRRGAAEAKTTLSPAETAVRHGAAVVVGERGGTELAVPSDDDVVQRTPRKTAPPLRKKKAASPASGTPRKTAPPLRKPADRARPPPRRKAALGPEPEPAEAEEAEYE